MAKSKVWKERYACGETEKKITDFLESQEITELEAKGIIFHICTKWFGERKARAIQIIMDL